MGWRRERDNGLETTEWAGDEREGQWAGDERERERDRMGWRLDTECYLDKEPTGCISPLPLEPNPIFWPTMQKGESEREVGRGGGGGGLETTERPREWG